jgi:Fe-S cluster biogenesis protein NfuA/nitrite reductase/ring-hydroxylating ferredoxin subunit
VNAALQPALGDSQAEAAAELERQIQAITRLEAIVAGWEPSFALTVQALKSAIEDLNKQALRSLIRSLKDEPAAQVKLREALADPLVYAVLRFHGLVRAPLAERIELALAEVRPFMAEHGGDVELVAVRPPDGVELRLVGACHGCPSSSQTLSEGVERAIRSHCPEIVNIVQVSRGAGESRATASLSTAQGGLDPGREQVVHFISPFARHSDSGWVDVASVADIAHDGVSERRVGQRSVLLSRQGQRVVCFDNCCAHLGMPLDMAEVADGVITCSYHGFRYLLESGECLTAPEVQLRVHAVRVVGERVQIRLDA